MLSINQPYHLVEKSPWALLSRFNVFNMVRGFIRIFFLHTYILFFTGLVGTLIMAYQ